MTITGMTLLRRRLARFQLPIFFLLAYAITWSAQIPAYIYAHNSGYTLTNEQNLLHVINLFRDDLDPGLTPYLLIAIFSFGPALAGSSSRESSTAGRGYGTCGAG